MADLHPQPWQQSPPGTVALWRKQVASAPRFILTVVVTVVLTLLMQAVLPGRPISVVSPETHASATRPPTAPASVSLPLSQHTPAPLASPMLLSAAHIQTDTIPIDQQIAELRAEINRLWSAYYLARAANQIADAEAALRINNLSEVELVLATVGSSLDRAYERSAEQEKGPISEFRLQIGTIYEDLRTRPEGLDQRLRRLRQSMLNLVDSGN